MGLWDLQIIVFCFLFTDYTASQQFWNLDSNSLNSNIWIEWYWCFTIAEWYDFDHNFTLGEISLYLPAQIINHLCSSCFYNQTRQYLMFQSTMIHIFKYDTIRLSYRDSWFYLLSNPYETLKDFYSSSICTDDFPFYQSHFSTWSLL